MFQWKSALSLITEQLTVCSKDNNASIADIDVHRTEGPLCSLSFESERYGPHAYHGDDIAF